MTQQRHREAGRRSRPGAWSPLVWGPCVVVGLLLLALAVVLHVDGGRRAPGGHSVPRVSLGVLPAGREVGTETTPPAPAVGTPLPAGSRLRLARLGLDAPIARVGVVANVMQIPRDPHAVGWWTGGAAPGGARGSTVIVGHVNYRGVTGALAVLPAARPGDTVLLVTAGRRFTYRVVAVRSYPKSAGIPAAAFSVAGPAGLVLITCGGRFDRATGNYADNIVAYAAPVS